MSVKTRLKVTDALNKVSKRDKKRSLDIAPVQILPFSSGKRTSPGKVAINEGTLDFLTGIVCKQEIPQKCVVCYCQVIDASPTELSAVYTLLKKSVAMGKEIGIKDIMVVFDLATYAKAIEVRWQKQEELNKVVIRLGAFHTVCTFIAVIGKRFEDILIESDLLLLVQSKGLLRESTTTEL